MDAHSHNLLEPYYTDPKTPNVYWYNTLRADVTNPNSYFKVTVNRTITRDTGIVINVTEIKDIAGGGAPSDAERTFLTSEVNEFLGLPRNGTDCFNAGWTYIGNWATNQASIQPVIDSATGNGWSFKTLQYFAGYFLYGCAETKQFYDKNT